MILPGQQSNNVKVGRLAVIAGAAMGLAMHVQPTLVFGDHVLRASLSDLLLLPLLILPLIVLIRTPKALPWACIFWAAALCLVLSTSFAHSVLERGAPTSWAITKLVGGYMLLAYLCAGAAIVVVGGERARTAFVLGFVLIMAVVVALFCVQGLLPEWFGTIFGVTGGRFTGLASNPHAAGLMFLLALCLAITHARVLDFRLRSGASWLLAILAATSLLLTTSGAVWGATVVCLPILLVLRVITVRKLSLVLAMSVGIAFTVTSVGNPLGGLHQLKVNFGKIERVLGLLGKAENAEPAQLSKDELKAEKYSIGPRVATNAEAFRLWQSAPLLGKGLGYFLDSQRGRQTFGEVPIQIHNTLLWLLAETGLVGCAVFIGFVLCGVYSLWRLSRGAWPADKARFALAVLVFIVGWQIMSLAHELMYQRIAFFVLGLALAGNSGAIAPVQSDTQSSGVD